MEETWLFISENILPHWPFLVVMLAFTIIGRFTSTKLFTRKRAYTVAKGKWPWENQWFWWWGRETLSLHPIISGTLLGLIWSNPEFSDPSWPISASVGYFAGAGVASLFSWNFMKSYAKRQGVVLSLPGESVRPGEYPPDHMPDPMPSYPPVDLEEDFTDK